MQAFLQKKEGARPWRFQRMRTIAAPWDVPMLTAMLLLLNCRLNQSFSQLGGFIGVGAVISGFQKGSPHDSAVLPKNPRSLVNVNFL